MHYAVDIVVDVVVADAGGWSPWWAEGLLKYCRYYRIEGTKIHSVSTLRWREGKGRKGKGGRERAKQ